MGWNYFGIMELDKEIRADRPLSLQSAPADVAASGHPGAVSIAGLCRWYTRPNLSNSIHAGEPTNDNNLAIPLPILATFATHNTKRQVADAPKPA